MRRQGQTGTDRYRQGHTGTDGQMGTDRDRKGLSLIIFEKSMNKVSKDTTRTKQGQEETTRKRKKTVKNQAGTKQGQ